MKARESRIKRVDAPAVGADGGGKRVTHLARQRSRHGAARLWPLLLVTLLLVTLLLACCPVPGEAAAGTETAFAGHIESLALPYATASLADGRLVRLSLVEEPPPAGLAPGMRVYVEGLYIDDVVIVRRIASI